MSPSTKLTFAPETDIAPMLKPGFGKQKDMQRELLM